MSTPFYLSNLINGKNVPSRTGRWVDNINPTNAQVVNKIPDSDQRDVEDAVQAALAALPSWRAKTEAERGEYLNRIADEMEKIADQLVAAESRDMGKPYMAASAMDIPGAIRKFRFYASAVANEATNYYQMPDGTSVEHRDPVGVVGLISPWNFPLFIISEKVSASIMCGNTCVAKPSELSPTTAFMLGQAVQRAGVPPGVINIVMGTGVSAGAPLVRHPKVRAVSFTGGCETGSFIASEAAKTFKKVQLELGGKNPTIVFDDCYFDETVEGVAQAGLMNTGQICIAGSRLIIQKGIADKFVAALKKHIKEAYTANVGDPKTAVLGPLSSHAHRDKVESYVELAKKEGGKITMGGGRPKMSGELAKGAFFEPTIIEGLDYRTRTATEEIFGPVITVHPFETEEEAVKIANVVQHGLGGSVWTSDIRRGQRVARQIESGMVWINCWAHGDERQPFGGVKNSGMGREGGLHSIDFFTEIKPIVSKL